MSHKYQKVNGAAHAVLLVLICDDKPVLQQTFHEACHCAHKLDSLISHSGVVLTAVHHDLLKHLFVGFIPSSSLHQCVQFGNHLILKL